MGCITVEEQLKMRMDMYNLGKTGITIGDIIVANI